MKSSSSDERGTFLTARPPQEASLTMVDHWGRSKWLVALLFLFHEVTHAGAGIVTDGSVGSSGYLGQPQVLTPGHSDSQVISIPASAGSVSGKNLFHSFDRFNIGFGQKVIFEDAQSNFLDNVIARITGGSVSTIDGTLSVTPGGHANFYLLNPNGVLFGNGARIDVPGNFHVTTASYLKFADGAKYGSDLVTSRLSAANPSAFGFSTTTHQNNVLIGVSQGAELATKNPGTAIDLVGANIKVNGGSIKAEQEGSEIRLVAARGGKDISLSSGPGGYLPLPNLSPQKNIAGTVDVEDGGRIVTDSPGANKIGGWSLDLNLRNNAQIVNLTRGNQPGSPDDGIDWHAARILIVDQGVGPTQSAISTINQGSAKGSSLRLEATQKLTLVNESASEDPTSINSLATGEGIGGSITIRTGQLQMQGLDFNHQALIGTLATSSGNAGDLSIQASRGIQLTHDAAIKSISVGPSSSGDLHVQTPGQLSIFDRSLISNEANNKDQLGSTGSIFVHAGRILIDYKAPIREQIVTGIINANRNFNGNLGNVNVDAKGDIKIIGGYHYSTLQDNHDGIFYTGIGASTSLNGQASRIGDINIHAGGELSILGIGKDMEKGIPAIYRFDSATIATGIYSTQFSINNDKASQSDLPNIRLTADGGINMRNGLVAITGFNSGTIHPPTVSIASAAAVSLFRSSIGIADVSVGQVDTSAKPAVKVSGAGVELNDRSVIYSNVPGGGIAINSSKGIYMASETVNYNYGLSDVPAYGPADSIIYNASYGKGDININSASNLILFKTLIGGFSNDKRQQNLDLHLKLKAENILLGGAIISLGGDGQQFDLKKSSIDLDSKGLIPFFNVLNAQFFTGETGYSNGIHPVYPKGFSNIIEKFDNDKKSFNFSLTGTVFGINGVLPVLNLPRFKDNDLGDACESTKASSFAITGRGKVQNGSSLIFQ